MKKKLSATLMAFMLVLQVLSSGFLMPMSAFAATNDNTATTQTDTKTQVGTEADNTKESTPTNATAQDEDSSKAVEEIPQSGETNKQVDQENKKGEEINGLESQITKDTQDKSVTIPNDVNKKENKKLLKKLSDAEAKKVAIKAQSGEIIDNIIKKVTMTNEKPTISESGMELKGDKLDEIRPDIGTPVYLNFEWKLPAGDYSNGSTFTFDLPGDFKQTSTINGDLTGDVGTYEVTPEGKVTFTFNAKIEEEDVKDNGLSGYFYIGRGFDANKIGDSSKVDVSFDFGHGSIATTIPIHFNSNDTVAKKGTAYRGAAVGNKNATDIEWTIDINTGENNVTGAKVEDTLADGLSLVPGSVTKQKIAVSRDGKFTSTVGDSESVASTTDGQKVTINVGNISEAYRITFKTEIAEDKRTETTTNFSNKATYTGNIDGTPISKESNNASVNVSYNKALEKSSGTYDHLTGKITWVVKYNYNQKNLTGDAAMIHEKLSGNHEFAEIVSVKKMTIGDDGSATDSGENAFVTKEGTSNTDFNLKFPDGNNAYELTYATKPSHRVLENSETVMNQVALGKDSDSFISSKNATLQQKVLTKSASPDYKDKTITWTLNVNQDGLFEASGYDMSNVTITDTFNNQNLTLKKSDINADGGIVTLLDADGHEDSGLTETNYGFKIHFDTIPAGTSPTITYTTSFDSTKPVPEGGYKNTAVITSDDLAALESSIHQSVATQTAVVSPGEYTTNNGKKKGSYNPKTKTFDWTVDVNYNLYDVQDAIVEDTFTGNQQIVPESLEVYKLNLSPDDNGISLGDPIVCSENCFKPNETGSGFEVDLGNIGKTAYRIVYSTTIEGKEVESEYKNTAVLKDGANPISNSLEESITPKYADDSKKLIDKSGQQGTGANDDTASWELVVNKNQSKIPVNAQITDTLKGNQLLLKDSIELYEVVPPENNNYNYLNNEVKVTDSSTTQIKSADYEVSVEANQLTITFKKAIERAYVVKYKSLLTGDTGDTVSNEASFQNTTISSEENTNKQFDISWSEAGGGASITGNGQLKVKKVGPSGEALSGAEFELYTASTGILLETLKTDEDGIAVTENKYKYKDYKLKEISAPTGYKISSELANGKIYTFGKDNNPQVTIVNSIDSDVPGCSVTFINKDGIGTPIKEGTDYKIIRVAEDSTETVVAKFTPTVNNDGEFTLPKLPDGKYKLEQTLPPLGYEPTAAVEFTVDSTNCSAKHDIINEESDCIITVINKDGSDQDINLDSIYKIVDESGQTVVYNGTTYENIKAEDGKLTVPYLPKGEYKLVQTDAPAGYALANDVPFTVDNKSCTGNITVVNDTCDFTILYTGPTDATESDAKFKLVKVEDNEGTETFTEIASGLTVENGKVLLGQPLNNGKYKLLQTSTPVGYAKAEDKTFEITSAGCITISVENEPCNDLTINYTGPSSSTATFDLYKVEKDADGKETSSTILYSDLKVEDGKVIVKGTDENVVKFLAVGTYKLVQTKTPTGYTKAEDKEFDVTEGVCLAEITLANNYIPPASTPTCPIEFNVVDSKTNNGIGNATFEVKQNGVTVATVTSDASGKVSLPALTVGDYQLVQTSSKAGYEFNKEPISFSVKNDNGTCTVTISTVKNDPKTCPVDITVIDADATNIKVAGATFTIKDKDGKVVAENATSDKDGKIIVKGLVAGDYTLVQTSVPNGYEKSADVSFTVKTKEDGTCENTVVVVKNVPKQCDVVFINKDEETGKVVKGSSTFVVKDQDGKTVTTVTSDSNGKITVAHLKPGTYELVQQKAPSGYEEQSGTITFTVKKGECGPNIVIDNVKVDEPKDPKNDNNKGNGKTPNKNKDEDTTSPNNNKASKSGNNSATFKVTDKDHAHKYKDDVYKLVDENGKTIASGLKVNKDGNIVVEGLPDGDYHLVKLPQTGVQNSLYASLMGLVLVLLGGYAIYRGRRKKSIM